MCADSPSLYLKNSIKYVHIDPVHIINLRLNMFSPGQTSNSPYLELPGVESSPPW